jgi:hypothetical protein
MSSHQRCDCVTLTDLGKQMETKTQLRNPTVYTFEDAAATRTISEGET